MATGGSVFRATLSGIVNGCDGALSAVLMDFDGIAIDTQSAAPGELDMEAVTAELCATLGQIRRAAGILQLGELEEVAIRSERLTFIVRVVSKDYFLGLAMSPESNLGKGRYLLRRAAPELRAELL